MRKTLDLVRETMANALNRNSSATSLPPEAAALVAEYQKASFALLEQTLGWNQLKDDMIRITVETFSEKELDDMIAFLKTPTGRAMTERADALMQKGAAIGQERVGKIEPELQRLSQEYLRKMQALRPAPPAAKPKPLAQ